MKCNGIKALNSLEYVAYCGFTVADDLLHMLLAGDVFPDDRLLRIGRCIDDPSICVNSYDGSDLFLVGFI